MRNLSILICFFVLVFSVPAQTTVSVAQLEQFLTSSRATKLSDLEIAERLSRVDLSEELTASSLARITDEAKAGPETLLQLEILSGVSVIQAPPSAEVMHEVAPDREMQKRIVDSARAYAAKAMSLIPDFLAVRETRSFNNVPVDGKDLRRGRGTPMRFASETHRAIAFRKGREVNPETEDGTSSAPGFSTRGEFGGILGLVLNDALDRSLEWHRWQMSESGVRTAVFGYEVPRSSSHYSVDFCCYQKSLDEPVDYVFKDNPGYHGEIYVDPLSGRVEKITLEADLRADDPLKRSAVAVQYGEVMIGGKLYVCPVKSVAISEFHSTLMERIERTGVEKRVNEVQFRDYRKFGSSSRILTGLEDQREQ